MTYMAESVTEVKQCTRITDGARCEREATATHQWCKKCKAAYQGEYRALQLSRAYSDGARAMRQAIAVKFAGFGMMAVAAREVARFAGETELPVRDFGASTDD